MSHSTHVGFNGPPATIAKVSEFRANSLGDAALSFHMRATGVGQVRADTASTSAPPSQPFVGVQMPWCSAVAVGVGHILTAL